MNSKQAKKLRKYYREGLNNQGIKDGEEYTSILKRRAEVWRSACYVLLALLILSFLYIGVSL